MNNGEDMSIKLNVKLVSIWKVAQYWILVYCGLFNQHFMWWKIFQKYDKNGFVHACLLQMWMFSVLLVVDNQYMVKLINEGIQSQN